MTNQAAAPVTPRRLRRPFRAEHAVGRWRDLAARAGEAITVDVDVSAARLSRRTAVLVLEPRTG